MDKWPFERWLRLAVTQYGMTPDGFWQMSVIDWLALIKPAQSPHMSRETLNTLSQSFPDGDENE